MERGLREKYLAQKKFGNTTPVYNEEELETHSSRTEEATASDGDTYSAVSRDTEKEERRRAREVKQLCCKEAKVLDCQGSE